ncbi:MAG: hypothetical protein HC895_09175 [Leptolyngbyaceae cyanobacterium SM1_3_5]|nr:hypothetical protein [Leptolyngbyaceae cyanobacterium SM1_3_5]
MEPGLYKPLASIPLGQTVQRFARLPLGQFSTGSSLQRRLSPTLGQKLQATFQARPEQKDSIALPESANTPGATAQFVEPFVASELTESIDSIDRPNPDSSTINELAPLGNRQPLADRQPLTQPANFLSLKSEPSFDQATPSTTKMGQMMQGAIPTLNRIHQQIQTQIQAQFKLRSPAEVTSPLGVRSPQPINPFTQTSTDTEAKSTPAIESTPAIQSKPEILRSLPPQADIFQPPVPVFNESEEESATNDAATDWGNSQNSPAMLQRQAEPQRSSADQAQNSMQVEPIADPVFTVEEDIISASDTIAPPATNPTATHPTTQASDPTVQRQLDSTSAALNSPEAIAATETTIQRQMN